MAQMWLLTSGEEIAKNARKRWGQIQIFILPQFLETFSTESIF